MASGKIDQSLDEILSSNRKAGKNGGRNTRPRRTATGKPTPPVGGIQKATKPARGWAKANTAKASGATGESKIMVSGLNADPKKPPDVSERQIKEYFAQTIGQVKRAELSYGPGGASRGIAYVVFHSADGASKAFAASNGILIDNRPIKVEVIVSQANLIPQPKSLTQRISQSKAQPKSAAVVKTNGAKNAVAAAAAGKGAKNGKPRKSRNSRPAKKSAEELDSEMADYFAGGASNENAEQASATVMNGDEQMVDEIE